jgi:MraZ protein
VVFYGTYTLKLDTKGRLVLPAKFREELSAGVALVEGQDKCVVVHRAADYHQIAASLPSGPLVKPEVRDFKRKFLAGMQFETPDRQGRVVVPTILRAKAALENEVVVLGVGDCLEIWNPANWEVAESQASESFANLTGEGLAGLAYTEPTN